MKLAATILMSGSSSTTSTSPFDVGIDRFMSARRLYNGTRAVVFLQRPACGRFLTTGGYNRGMLDRIIFAARRAPTQGPGKGPPPGWGIATTPGGTAY